MTRRDWVSLLAACAWLAATAWVRPLMLPDEGRYVGVAWEMLQRGDWMVPTLDGMPFFHKPPLFYWITEAALAVAGPREWAARLAPLLGGWLALVSVYALTLRWASRELAGHALVAMLAQPLFYLGGQFANLDMLVAGCITATIVLLADAALSAEAGRPGRLALMGAYAMAGLGVLAKGLIGIVLPGLVIFAWLLATRRPRLVLRLLSLPGLLLLAAIAVPWFVAMQQRFDGFYHYFFVVQHFKRFAAAGFNNAQPAWFYGLLLLLAFLPWLPWMRQLWRAVPAGGDGRQLRVLMALWAVVIVVFFSVPRSKLIGYILPAVPPLAWLAADGFRATGRWPRGWRAAALLGTVVSLAVVVGFGVRTTRSNEALGTALRDRHHAGEPVMMLGGYAYDVPFYAHLSEHALVVENWTSPDMDRRDNWRKELADAGRFVPDVAATRLMLPQAVPGALCVAPRSWVIGPSGMVAEHQVLANATPIASHGDMRLWRFDAAQACKP